MPHGKQVTRHMILHDMLQVLPSADLKPSFLLYQALGGRYRYTTIVAELESWSAAVVAWRARMRRQIPTPAAVAQTRACLRCDRAFLSTWAGHRLCDPCRERDVREPGYERVYHIQASGQRRPVE